MAVDLEERLAEDVAAYARELRAWVDERRVELAPYSARPAAPIAEVVEHDRGLMRLLYRAGWSRYGWPVSVGGLGGDARHRAALYDAMADGDLEIPEAFVILETVAPVLCRYSPELAARHLPSYLAGNELWGQGFSEPSAGSDLAHLGTRAVAEGDHFRLTGQKVWTTLGQFAQHAIVLARTGDPGSAHRGLSMLWVDLSSPGVSVRPIAASSGRDEFAEMFFDDVEVPRSALIGEEGQGWSVAMYLLQFERGMYAWQRSAVLQRRLRNVGATLAEMSEPAPSVLMALGHALGLVARLRALSRLTVAALAAESDPGSTVSADKITLGRAEVAVADAVRLAQWSAVGFDDSAAAQVAREEWFYSRASTVFGGAVDIQLDIVADRVLRLPREVRE